MRTDPQEKFAKDRDWEQHHTPRNVLLAMVGEVNARQCFAATALNV
jgi:hypothetical protein